MSKGIIIAVFCGIFTGYVLIPAVPFGEAYVSVLGNMITAVLCGLLFLVGVGLGRDDTVIGEIRRVGLRVLLFPVAAIGGTFFFAAGASVFLPVTAREAMAVAGGFGWYSLAPAILMNYSARISAICFLHNIMREMSGIVLIPIAARTLGYLEASALPGVAVSDVCLPIIKKSTGNNIIIYAIAMGWLMGFTTPWVGVIVS